ncbi:MAG: tRNA (adenosine(37)-N6)-threonylcarbamoyltransferase complex ATPase subunit type 1 TsaE [Candidatus Saccharicenans sp.]|nr:MAG: tRNA (adenosine(37)-N6)-threonylcarbamoyltransferase complex ATPase subunit type 1 TsaE [Candidatus Aminicenantes bacterium]HEK86657.1 tRNA (adenosine(37)-N6)-threonylcarbamoyltransferase complex ATPase subunit type 1 TsaE [Candidatus Aminicenantes bacterium]
MKSEQVELTVTTYSEKETFEFARKLGRLLTGNEVILISGELGVGKTVFVRGLAAGLGVKDESLICSPSFTLINVYPGRVPFYHVDLYRLEKPEEIADLGLEDYFGAGLVAIEWAERIPFEISGLKVITVVIEIGEVDERRIKIKGLENWPEMAKVQRK